MTSSFNNSNTTDTMAEMMNKSADYWFYDIGVNVIPAITREKNTFITWSIARTNQYLQKIHEDRKKNGDYNNGIAIIPGKLLKGHFKGQISGCY